MTKRIPEEDLRTIEDAARQHPEGITAQQISRHLRVIPLRTLQYRLKYPADNKRLVKEGEGRWAKYGLPPVEALVVREVLEPVLKGTERDYPQVAADLLG